MPLTLAVSVIATAGATCVQLLKVPSPTKVRQIWAPLSEAASRRLEVMRNTLSIKDCIENPEKAGTIRDFIEAGFDQYGMQTFDRHLMERYNEGVIDFETAKSAATSPADFERNVKFG